MRREVGACPPSSVAPLTALHPSRPRRSARVQYEGALNDMIDWWPKVRPGGVMAGHDYLDAILPPDVIFGSKSAADRFAVAVNRPLHVTQNDGDYPSFWIIK